MANYKPTNNIHVGNGIDLDFPVPKRATVKVLYFFFNAGTAAKSLFDASTAAIYQVPSGTTFYMCGIVHELQTVSTSSFLISVSGSADTDGTLKYTVPVITGGFVTFIWPIPDIPQFSATKYVNGIDALGKTKYVKVIGYEL